MMSPSYTIKPTDHHHDATSIKTHPYTQTISLPNNDLSPHPSPIDQDALDLARAGKKQILQRNSGLLSMIGFSAALMCTWEGVLTSFILGYNNGGPAGLIYSLIVNWIGTLCVFSVVGEMSSMIPTASGQYHWVNVLAPPSCKRFLSYLTGWLTMTGWIAALAATAFFIASWITALVQLNDPSVDLRTWEQTLLFWAVLGVGVFFNTVTSRALPVIEVVILVMHVVGFFAILIPLVYLAPTRKSAYEVFTTFTNNGGWSTQTLSFFIGLQGTANPFTGADGPVHMSEEVHNASVNVPRSIIYGILINGVLSFGMLIAILFCSDPASVPSDVLYPIVPIFATALNSNAGATVLVVIVMTLQLCAAIPCLASTSRMIWAFARDRGLPGWRHLSRVDERTAMPLWAIALTVAVSALLGFVNLGSNTAFNDVISLTLEGLFTSYLLPCALLLWHRVSGRVAERREDGAESGEVLVWGPWRIPGWIGVVNNFVACCYLILISFFSLWPPAIPVDASNMNYSVAAWGAVVVFSIVYYAVWAKRTYKGSIVEVDVSQATIK